MKKNKYLILTILWMIFIFVMSQTPGNDSSKQSNFIVDIIIHILPITRDTLSFIVRKCAHMTEYAILAFLIYKTIVHIEKSLVKSFIFTFLYACTDEFHQLFIAGRAGQFRDVCIDSTGALIMILKERTKKSVHRTDFCIYIKYQIISLHKLELANKNHLLILQLYQLFLLMIA